MKRERLTITLKNSVLELLDQTIDGHRIRNRSHAVEVLLSQSLLPRNTKVLILAGGKGVKFRPLTYEMPKAMIPINGKPLLAHTVERLQKQGLTDITISVGHLGDHIKKHFKDGSKWGLSISYLDQLGRKEGTANPLREAVKHFQNGPFIVIYGDVFTDINFIDMLDFHRSLKGALLTMALTSVDRVSEWGLARLSGNRITGFEEKPKKSTIKSHLVNAGVYVVEPRFFDYIGENAVRLESDIFPRLAEEGKLAGYAFDGRWYDIATPEVYAQVINT